jgi:hypothetical protein
MARTSRRVSTASTPEGEVTADDFAADLSNAFLQCRELGHQWRPRTASFDPSAQVFDRSLRCPSCKTIRRQVLTSSGHVLRNAYDYPDGYLSKHLTPGTYSRDVFRLEALTRFLDKNPTTTSEAS